jgi:urease accessory protein
MLQADLLIVNKIDLAPHVGADLDRIRQDVQINRPQKGTIYTNLRSPEGAKEVFAAIQRDALFGRVAH